MLVFQHREKSCFGRTVITLLFINRLKQNWYCRKEECHSFQLNLNIVKYNNIFLIGFIALSTLFMQEEIIQGLCLISIIILKLLKVRNNN